MSNILFIADQIVNHRAEEMAQRCLHTLGERFCRVTSKDAVEEVREGVHILVANLGDARIYSQLRHHTKYKAHIDIHTRKEVGLECQGVEFAISHRVELKDRCRRDKALACF